MSTAELHIVNSVVFAMIKFMLREIKLLAKVTQSLLVTQSLPSNLAGSKVTKLSFYSTLIFSLLQLQGLLFSNIC